MYADKARAAGNDDHHFVTSNYGVRDNLRHECL